MRAVPVALAMLALCSCGGSGGGKAESGEACGAVDVAEQGQVLPSPLVLPPGQKLLRVRKQGRTSVAFASTDGQRDDIVGTRDAVLEVLKTQGFTVKGTDQEPGFEAEAELSGAADGTIRVTPLCAGRLEVRYKIEG